MLDKKIILALGVSAAAAIAGGLYLTTDIFQPPEKKAKNAVLTATLNLLRAVLLTSLKRRSLPKRRRYCLLPRKPSAPVLLLN